jgi:predicted permease
MFIIPFYALNETVNVPIHGVLLAFILGAGGISFTNGGIGTYPLLVGIVSGYYLKKEGIGHPEAIANALGMLIWMSQTLLMIVLGLISLYVLPRKIKKHG